MNLVITLEPLADISCERRHEAENKYRDVLLEVFGGPERVWARYQAAEQARQGRPAGQHDQHASRDISRWEEATHVAAKVALGSPSTTAANASFRLSRRD